LWNVRRDLLLVSENVRPHDEREPGQDSFLGYLSRRVRDLCSVSRDGNVWNAAALLAIWRIRVSEAFSPPGHIRHCGSDNHSADSDLVLLQFLLEHVQGQEGDRQSLGSDDARLDDSDSASARQFRGSCSAGASWP